MAETLLRRPEVELRTGLARSTLYDWMSKGDFPQPVRLGARLVAWRESDVTAWMERCVQRETAPCSRPVPSASLRRDHRDA